MSSITIKAEVFGCIDDVAKESIALADKLGVGICFDFNGVECYALPGEDAEKISASYREEIRSHRTKG